MEIIRLENVTKSYGDKLVLNHIDKVFHRGEAAAFVGHNGCGKSTLLRIIAGLTVPSDGRAVQAPGLLFHYIPEKFPPTPVTARQYLLNMGILDGMRRDEAGRRIESLGEDFFLSELLDVPMKSLSKGTLQKIGVIQALMTKPDVLLLDEPVSGQDKESQKVLIEKANELRDEDVTILMSCHEEHIVNAIAQDVYTIREGRLEAYEPAGTKMCTVILENAGGLEAAGRMKRYGRYYRLEAEETECDRILPGLLSRGWRLRGMYNEEDS
ncbi:ABC transporter ATP-binding protein [Clostridium sp. AF15-17LB]|nr:ABC transporter ATP-binding protein [Clostridium sp. AF15-17LB]